MGDLFLGAVIPGLILVVLYLLYIMILARLKPASMPLPDEDSNRSPGLMQIIKALLPPLFLILAVLGSIIGGIATPTEAASVGAVGVWPGLITWLPKLVYG